MRFHPLMATLLLASALAPAAQAKPIPKAAKVIFEKTTNYHHIQVYDIKGVRTLSFDGSEESFMKLNEPVNSGFEYIGFFHAPFAINGGLTDVLMVGLGGASAAKQFQAYYP
ncbi:MAG TPA: spermine synthase, partial [bacterium]|nr:spermine synthase [bacterium]